MTARFAVTVPASAQPGTRQLTARVTYQQTGPGGLSPGLVEASASVVVPYSSLAAAYNNTGISDNSDEAAASYDGGLMANLSIDTDPQQQEAASPRMLVVRSSLR